MGQSTPIKRKPVVLVVEDEWLINEMVAQALTEWGFAVHAVDNADDALEWLLSGESVDLLFTDVNLPGLMDGTALALRAREIRADLPVVYASGGVTRARINAVPGSTFVPKPYSPGHICALVARLLAEPKLPPSPLPTPLRVYG